jgi:hypothetical protein
MEISKAKLVGAIATYLVESERTMHFDELAQVLNQLGVETSYGSEYSGGRGVAKLAHACYDTLKANNMEKECDAVARAFVDKNGNFSYD